MQLQVQLPLQGSRSIHPQAYQILQRAWKMKDLSPLIKAFTWRLIRRALGTAERAAGYSTHIDNHCASCGALENDAHLFFHCHLPRAVWFSSNPAIRTDNLPQENDGAQLTLSALISDSTFDSLPQKILITLWYLWKARNDTRFQRKIWTPWQVHHAVSAYIATQSGVQVTNDDTPASAATQSDNKACQDAADLTTVSQHNRSISIQVQTLFLQAPSQAPLLLNNQTWATQHRV